MSGLVVGWIFAGVAALAAAAGFWRTRAEASRSASLSVDAERLAAELGAARKQLEQRTGNERRRGEEMGELRRKLEKAKKRAALARDEQREAAARVRQLEHDLELRGAEVRAMRLELSRGPRLDEGDEPRRAPPAPPPRPAPVAAPPPPPPPAAPPQPDEQTAALADRAEKAEAQSASRARELGAARKEVGRLQERLRTQNKVYMALRGELEAKKDRLRQQREEIERLQAIKVALVDAEAPGLPPVEAVAEPPADTPAEID